MRTSTFVGRTLAALATLTLAAMVLAQGAPGLRTPLVPCTPAEMGPCVQVATSVADIVGVWKQYVGNPAFDAPGGMGFVRYRHDGSYSLAPTVADTAAPFGAYPRGSITFEGEIATIVAVGDAVVAECRSATFQILVLHFGTAPVGLTYVAIQDGCVGRRADMAMPLLWVGE